MAEKNIRQMGIWHGRGHNLRQDENKKLRKRNLEESLLSMVLKKKSNQQKILIYYINKNFTNKNKWHLEITRSKKV